MEKYSNIPIFIPHYGCGNDCVFCNQRSITGKKLPPSKDEVREEIENFLLHLKNRKAQVAFFGGSFTGIDISMQREYLAVASEFLKNGKVFGIRLSTRPDYISREILEMLSEYGVTNIELGVQSMCDDVLKKANRGHSAADTERACELINEYAFTLGLQMMPGLPGDTEEKTIFTAKEIVRLGGKEARVYPTCVLKNTKLYDMYLSGEYTPLTVEKAVEWSAKAVMILEKAGVNVIRCGLQETDTLGDSIVAGGYHSAMGEMVKSRILREEIESAAKKCKDKVLNFKVPREKLSQYLGQKKCNIKYIEEKYKIKVNIVCNENTPS